MDLGWIWGLVEVLLRLQVATRCCHPAKVCVDVNSGRQVALWTALRRISAHLLERTRPVKPVSIRAPRHGLSAKPRRGRVARRVAAADVCGQRGNLFATRPTLFFERPLAESTESTESTWHRRRRRRLWRRRLCHRGLRANLRKPLGHAKHLILCLLREKTYRVSANPKPPNTLAQSIAAAPARSTPRRPRALPSPSFASRPSNTPPSRSC